MSEFRTFVVPFDFSAHSRAALFVASDLARRLGAEIHLVHVIKSTSYAYGYASYAALATTPEMDLVDVRESIMEAMENVVSRILDLPVRPEVHVFEGTVIPEVIRELVEKLNADLIVMGTHGRTGLANVFLGSVAERTLRRAPCPVLTVQAPEDDKE